MDKEEALQKLYELSVSEDGADEEAVHIYADEILVEMVPPEVKKAYLDLKEKVGFWYA